MPANTDPIFSRLPDIQWIGGITVANTTKDLTSGTSYLVFTADATNGGFITKIRFTPLGTNVATVARVWINNGSTPTTAANNTYYDQVTLPITTNSEVAAIASVDINLGFALPAGYRIYVTIGTTVAAGFAATVIGGKY